MSWLRVQKRLRGVVDRAVQQDLDVSSGSDQLGGGAIGFLTSMEAVVWCFIDTGRAPPEVALPAALASALLRPLETTQSVAAAASSGEAGNGPDDYDVDVDLRWFKFWVVGVCLLDTRAVLNVVLKDSPYHRLLLHALVQFHGLHSKVRTAEFQLLALCMETDG
jgi:hypothetical protein